VPSSMSCRRAAPCFSLGMAALAASSMSYSANAPSNSTTRQEQQLPDHVDPTRPIAASSRPAIATSS
jgi:hypothetical protein